MVNENIINRKDMATTEFIAAIELGSSKVTGIPEERTVTEACRYWHTPRKTLQRLSAKE